MAELARGVHDLGRGSRALAARPRLWKWLVAPSLVAIALLAAAVVVVARVFDRVVGWLGTHLPGWLGSIATPLLSAAAVVGLVLAAMLIFVAVAGAVAGPFLETLSEQLEAELTGVAAAPFSVPRFVHELAVSIGHGLRRLAAAVAGIAFVFALGLVPVVGPIAALVASAWLSARAAAYDCYDAVLARKHASYRDKLAFLARHRGRTLGLGGAVAGLLFVPILNVIALGIGAAGATVAYVELSGRDRSDILTAHR